MRRRGVKISLQHVTTEWLIFTIVCERQLCGKELCNVRNKRYFKSNLDGYTVISVLSFIEI